MNELVLGSISIFLIIIGLIIYIYIIFRKKNVNKHFYNRIENYTDDDFIDDFLEDNELKPLIPFPSNEIENNKIKKEKIENTKIKKENIQEVVNILINKKNYLFLSNNYKLTKGEHIKVIISNKTYFGTVLKSNYKKDISLMKNKPEKLIIKKEEKKKEIKENTDFFEYVPKKIKRS